MLWRKKIITVCNLFKVKQLINMWSWGSYPVDPTLFFSTRVLQWSLRSIIWNEGHCLKIKLYDELTHLKRPWFWERLRAGGEVDDRGYDGWMASSTQWTWVWVNSRSWWWTGRPGVLWFMESQRIGHKWATELTQLFGGMIQAQPPELSNPTIFLGFTVMRECSLVHLILNTMEISTPDPNQLITL